ncbi:hypothetical protein MHC_01965 [Mycoplasma haemocanis str. Illinois]|uniref:Uncharacterized protein n=1 Tax=Mycoplasma haemocanis (strain Illinois) TaxID=1111676 RepID=H6N6I7_MYCHN|nr:hypothetical protein [Mycoplasma haemocanis]AEW45259.1 hypothetical protein MHC_01965 [Mycoplasma haemocanis str. Illinois]
MISKVGVTAATALGGGMASYVGYAYVFKKPEKKTTIREKLGSFLLDTKSSDKWISRKTQLSEASVDSLVVELKTLKNGVTDDQIKNWCSEAASKVYEDVSALYFENIRTYCTFHVEDKLPEGYIGKDSGDWNKANDRLKQVQSDATLSGQMKAMKAKLTNASSTDDLKNWCLGVYEKPFLGEDDQDFMDAKDYCAKVESSAVSPAA